MPTNTKSFFLLCTRYILLVCCACSIPIVLLAQGQPDKPPLIFRLHNIIFIRPGTLEWDIEVESTQEQYFWANATLHCIVENIGDLRAAEISITATALPPATFDGSQRSGYDFRTTLERQEQRLNIGVLGPDEAQHCVVLQPGKSVLLARCSLQLGAIVPGGQIPTIRWRTTAENHNTTAIKTPTAIIEHGFERYRQQDNVELGIQYLQSNTTEFTAAQIIVDSLQATYIGDNLVRVQWNTLQERVFDRSSNLNAGFILRRNGRSIFIRSQDEGFRDTVGAFQKQPALKISGLYPQGRRYGLIDSVLDRSHHYRYELQFMDASPRHSQPFIQAIDTANATVPNAVIWYAQANPNPCASSTLVDFRIEDRIVLRAALYTLDGRLIEQYINGEEYTRGNYLLPVSTDKLAFGAYHLVFEGLPVNDTAVRTSRAIVRLQVSR